jgi:hypothetical protein
MTLYARSRFEARRGAPPTHGPLTVFAERYGQADLGCPPPGRAWNTPSAIMSFPAKMAVGRGSIRSRSNALKWPPARSKVAS